MGLPQGSCVRSSRTHLLRYGPSSVTRPSSREASLAKRPSSFFVCICFCLVSKNRTNQAAIFRFGLRVPTISIPLFYFTIVHWVRLAYRNNIARTSGAHHCAWPRFNCQVRILGNELTSRCALVNRARPPEITRCATRSTDALGFPILGVWLLKSIADLFLLFVVVAIHTFVAKRQAVTH